MAGVGLWKVRKSRPVVPSKRYAAPALLARVSSRLALTRTSSPTKATAWPNWSLLAGVGLWIVWAVVYGAGSWGAAFVTVTVWLAGAEPAGTESVSVRVTVTA